MSRIVILTSHGNVLASGLTEDQVIDDFCKKYGVTENDILNNTLEYVEMTSYPYRKGGKLYTKLFEKVIDSCSVETYIRLWR